MRDDCAFCTDEEVCAREIVRSDLAWSFPSNMPIVPGHVLICPIRHLATMEELSSDELSAMFALLKRLKVALRREFAAEGFNHAWNEAPIAGQSVPHLHLHVVPRKSGDAGITQYNPTKFLYRPGSRALSPESELAEVAHLLKEALAV